MQQNLNNKCNIWIRTIIYKYKTNLKFKIKKKFYLKKKINNIYQKKLMNLKIKKKQIKDSNYRIS